MSPENTGTDTAENTNEVATPEAASAIDPAVKASVVLADDLFNTFRDKRTAATVLMMASPEDRAVIERVNTTIKTISASQKQIYALSVEASKNRNAGKKLPPSKQKAKDEAEARRKAKEAAENKTK